jgi:hypothetical protein
MTPMDTLTVIGGTIVSAKVVEKVLGPTAEYIGEGVASFAKKRELAFTDAIVEKSQPTSAGFNPSSRSVPDGAEKPVPLSMPALTQANRRRNFDA